MHDLESLIVYTWRIPNTPINIYERVSQEINRLIESNPPLFHEIYTLVTCQRIIFVGFKDAMEGLQRTPVFKNNVFQTYLEVFTGKQAFTYLSRVTAALDSLVLGEPQISGQVKQAFLQAEQQKNLPPQLVLIFQYIFKTANKIITSTNIQKGKVSFISLIETDLQEIYQTYWKNDSKPLKIGILGTGEMAEKSFKLLLKLPTTFQFVFYTNRHDLLERNNASLPQKLIQIVQHPSKHPSSLPQQKIETITFRKRDFFFHDPWDFDILILAIRNEHATPIITPSHLSSLLSSTIKHLVIIDLGVPRLSDPEIKTNPHITLIQVTELIDISKKNIQKRQEAIQAAEIIIQQQLENLQTKLKLLEKRLILVDYRNSLSLVGNEKKQELLMKIKPPYTSEKINRAFDVFMNTLIHHSQKELEKLLLQKQNHRD